MKEYKVGEQIVLEVKETESFLTCMGCFFFGASTPCNLLCNKSERSDGKNVIFVEKGK